MNPPRALQMRAKSSPKDSAGTFHFLLFVFVVFPLKFFFFERF
jgi:hypothetical protein